MAPRLLLFTSLAIPASALLLTTYLQSHPLPSQKTRTIKTSHSLSPTCLTSPSLHIVNPRSHISATDSRKIILSKSEVGNLTDEEILARFLRGFYGGWVFWPEKGVIAAFRAAGRPMIAVGFEGIPMDGPQIADPAEISRTHLPEKFTVMMSGNFMVLDKHVNPPEVSEESGRRPSFIEIGFGDNRRGFAGMHRFEVARDVVDEDNVGKEEVRLWYSSISCNPTVDIMPFPRWIFNFHTFYAQSLFRDGVAGVLRN